MDDSILLDITNIYYKYSNMLVKTALSMIPMGGVKFSWPVARENLTEGVAVSIVRPWTNLRFLSSANQRPYRICDCALVFKLEKYFVTIRSII